MIKIFSLLNFPVISKGNIRISITKNLTSISYSFSNNNFSTSKNNPFNQQQKIQKQIKNYNKIKLWSLQGLLSNAINEHLNKNKKAINNLNQDQQIELFKNYIKKHQNQSQSKYFNLIVNRYFSTVQYLPFNLGKDQLSSLSTETLKLKNMYKNLIETLNEQKRWGFIPHYYSILNRLKQNNLNQLNLLIGDYNDAMTQHYPSNSYVTLQQLCAMYPQKVPLSYRKRQQSISIRQNVQKRINVNRSTKIDLNHEPKFNEIIVINDGIKMWDEAYQVMLDCLPIKIRVPYHIKQPSFQFYRLGVDDFIKGFITSHKIIHPNIKLDIEQQSLEEFVKDSLYHLVNGQNSNNMKATQNCKRSYSIEIMDKQLAEDQRRQIINIEL